MRRNMKPIIPEAAFAAIGKAKPFSSIIRTTSVRENDGVMKMLSGNVPGGRSLYTSSLVSPTYPLNVMPGFEELKNHIDLARKQYHNQAGPIRIYLANQ